MYERFEEYLSKEFKGLPKTKAVNDFKEELLGNLVEKAEELKAKGERDEDKVFQLCVNSIDGFKETLKELRGKPMLIKGAIKAANLIVYLVAYLIVLTGVYLGISFAYGNWSESWLIFVVPNFVLAMAYCLALTSSFYRKGKYALGRLLIVPAISLGVVGAYLCVSVLMDMWSKSWLMLLFLPSLILLCDIIAGFAAKRNKILFAELMAVVTITSVMVYVTLGILGILAWHPYWLIIVGGGAASAIIFAVYLKSKTSKAG